MDPQANMAEMYRLASKILDGKATPDSPTANGDPARLAELCEALCEWYAGGGFMPKRDLLADIIRFEQARR